MAQLVAHLHGMQGVRGSSPLRSTQSLTGTRDIERCWVFPFRFLALVAALVGIVSTTVCGVRPDP